MADVQLTVPDHEKGGAGSIAVAGHRVELRLDGRRVSEWTDFELHVHTGEVVRGQLTFNVEELDIDVNALMSLVGNVDEKTLAKAIRRACDRDEGPQVDVTTIG